MDGVETQARDGRWCEAFFEELAFRMTEIEGRNLQQVSGPWIWVVDPTWTVGAMGAGKSGILEPAGSMAVVVRPYQVAVWYNGWLWGMFDPHGGACLEHPDPGGATFANLLLAMAEANGRETLAAPREATEAAAA